MARNSIIDDVTDCRMQIQHFFFSFNGIIPAGDGRAALWLHHWGGLWVISRQVLSATGGRHKTRTALLFRAHQPRRGFLLSPLSSNGIALTHRRDRRDAPIDLLSSPHIYHHRDRNR
jgi:hypothetical protein